MANQFSSKSGYVYETSPPPMPLPSYYDGEEEEENEERLLELLTVLVQMVRSKKPSTKFNRWTRWHCFRKPKQWESKLRLNFNNRPCR